MRNFVDQDKIIPPREMKQFLKLLRDDNLGIFDEALKFKSKITEKKFQEYRNKLIAFMDEKEEIALSLNGEEENIGYNF